MKDKKTVFFGFEKIAEELKAGKVADIFSSVANKYDIMNDVMSAGIHRLWKDEMVKKIQPQDGVKILDMAGGTGDIAFRIYKKFQDHNVNCEITIGDINQEMLDVGEARSIDKNLIKANFSWQQMDGERIPYEDNSFDYYTIAYGIRNFTDISKGLSEAFRVLKPGGKFLCLEFNNMDSGMLQKFYDLYSFNVIPKIGKLITGDEASYKYLVESIRTFPKTEEFVEMVEKAGFNSVKARILFSEVSNLYIATKNV